MNRLFFVIILLCLARSSEAQPELSFALKAGPNAAIWDRAHHDHKYGLSGGLAADLLWPFGERFSLGGQIALLYVPRGTKSISPSTGELIGTFRQHYFDVSVAIRPEARVGPAGIYLLVGGSWSILQSATRTSEPSGVKDDVDYRRNDVALLAGIGSALHLSSHRLGPFRLGTVFLEVRYARGLIDFVREDDSSAKNRTTSLMLGASFVLGSKSE